MTIQIYQQSVNLSTGDAVLEYWFRLKEHLVSVGWTVPQSSNGTTGGATGGGGSGGVGDHITSRSSLSQWSSGVSESWMVLRSPDAAREILFYRYSADDKEMGHQVTLGSSAFFPLGDETNQPAAPAGAGNLSTGAPDTWNDGIVTFIFGADDAAPYGWWSWCHDAGDYATDRHAMGMIPITDDMQPGDTDPVVWFWTAAQGWRYTSFDSAISATSASHCSGVNPVTGAHAGMSCWYLRDFSVVTIVPRDVPSDSAGDDLGFPVNIGRPASVGSGGYKGITTFLRWNGVQREAGETFAGLTRLSLGDFNVEWDGVTVPLL
jgi:hypothetical protein